MSEIVWDSVGARLYETGVKNGVLYPQISDGTYPLGVAWNGLIAINEAPSGAEANPLYADDTKYLNLMSAEEFGATIEAYHYPKEFGVCDGTVELATGVEIGQQTRKTFGLCYKTAVGNDVDGIDYGYKLHLMYGALASPSEKAYGTINESPEANTFSWEAKTTPEPVSGKKPSATVVIDSTRVDSGILAAIKLILYGTVGVNPRLPSINELVTLVAGGVPPAVSLTSIAPADELGNVAINANIVLTFNNKIHSESVVVTTAAGVIVAGKKTWDTAGKVLTFNPDADLTNAAVYIVTIGGVVDIYNQALATAVKNFTTIAL